MDMYNGDTHQDPMQQLIAMMQQMQQTINEQNQKLDEQNQKLDEQSKQLKDQNNQIRELSNKVNVFQECVKEINKDRSPEELIQSVKGITERALGKGTEAEVVLLDHENNRFFTLDTDGDRNYIDFGEDEHTDVSKALYIGKKTVISNTDGDYDIGDKGLLKNGNRNVAIVPVKSDEGEVMGAVLVSKDSPIDVNSLNTIDYVSNSFSTALETQKLDAENKILQCDQLTGLQNRHGAEQYLKKQILPAMKDGEDVSMVFMDIDNFKKFNDTYGHDAGDAVLKGVGDILKSECRKETDCAGRFGGEEEFMILRGMNEAQAMAVAERTRKRIAETPFDIGNGKTVGVTVSVGTAQFNKDEIENCNKSNIYSVFNDSVLKRADQNVYASKSKGKNCITGSPEATVEYNKHKSNSARFTASYDNSISKPKDNAFEK